MNGSKISPILNILISSGAYSEHNEINMCYRRGIKLAKGTNLQFAAEFMNGI
jgi:hypothetical protein